MIHKLELWRKKEKKESVDKVIIRCTRCELCKIEHDNVWLVYDNEFQIHGHVYIACNIVHIGHDTY